MAAIFAAALLALLPTGRGVHVSTSLDLRNWVVDYQRPTILPRLAPFDIPADAKMDALLANNSCPGPSIDVFVGDTVEVTIFNHLIDEQVTIEWEGVSMQKSPQTLIPQQGGKFTYVFMASKVGIFRWQATSAVQAARGLRGMLVVKSHIDPFSLYKERNMVLSDARQKPEICITESNSVAAGCPEIEKAMLNGQWGDGSKGWPTPVLEVKKKQCYRLHFLALSPPTSYFKVSIEDHAMQVLHLGSLVSLKEIEVHGGEGLDAILCADKDSPSYPYNRRDYEITMSYVGQSMSQDFASIMRYGSSSTAAHTPLAQVNPAFHTHKPHAHPVQLFGSVGSEQFDTSRCDKHVVFDIHDWIVDYKRPTVNLSGKASRQPPEDIPLANRKAALLVNNSYPGPVIEAMEGDLVCVTVVNNLVSEPAAIHWHGQHMKGYPAFDGVYGVHQGAIGPGGDSMTYRWIANAGTAFWHGHVQALQADKGMKGPMVIHAKHDPHKHLYDEERIVGLSDEWVNPGACLKSEGAQPGNPVCAEIEKASWNGQWGDGTEEYPWPMVTVEKGKCYRLRFIGMMGQAQNFQISIAGHNMTLIAVDGADVEPVQVSKFNLHAGERADVVVCADQEQGNYLMTADYDLANFLETAPAPKLPKVDSSKYWAFLNYKGHTEKPGFAKKKLLGGYKPPAGTGGGATPKAVAGFAWDTNLRSSWSKVRNVDSHPEPEKADVTYVLDVGIAAPSFQPGATDYAESDPLYMFYQKMPWRKPLTPLLHTKGECGADETPFINVPENATTVEVIINNLSPTAHVLHMHGMRFSVINYASFSESWCSNAHFECFFLPLGLARQLDCKGARLGDNRSNGPGNEYWGCPFDPEKDTKSQFLEAPLQKDMLSLWRRSWAVIRFKVDNPGIWLFHCHMEQHIPTGQMMAFNLLPSKQPPIPYDVPTEGPCKVWSGRDAPLRPPKPSNFLV